MYSSAITFSCQDAVEKLKEESRELDKIGGLESGLNSVREYILILNKTLGDQPSNAEISPSEISLFRQMTKSYQAKAALNRARHQQFTKFQGAYYYVSAMDPTTYRSAQTLCGLFDSHLPEFESREEMTVVKMKLEYVVKKKPVTQCFLYHQPISVYFPFRSDRPWFQQLLARCLRYGPRGCFPLGALRKVAVFHQLEDRGAQ